MLPRHASLAAIFLLLPLRLLAQSPQPQIEQARQFGNATQTLDLAGDAAAADLPDAPLEGSGDDAFGAQLILKRQERVRPFSAFAEIGAFVSTNVGLTRRDTHRDEFMVVTAGAAFSQRLGYDLRFDASARSSLYRYNEYRQLDFQSVDLSAGLAWSPPLLRGAEVLVRYTFTDLSTAKRIREFYTNHAVLLGVQKAIPFSRAHGVYLGLSAQWSATDPKETGRDEYVAFAGYRVQFTRSIDADLSYRYGHYIYREGDGREDDNHAVSLALHYTPVEWLSFSATSFLNFNRSNQPVFDYDVGNLGLALQLSVRF
jgi:hypothetical protein